MPTKKNNDPSQTLKVKKIIYSFFFLLFKLYFQVLNRTLKQSLNEQKFNLNKKKITIDSSVLTAQQKERLSNIPNSSSSWRSKRAEDETLDVVADPLKIVDFSTDSNLKSK